MRDKSGYNNSIVAAYRMLTYIKRIHFYEILEKLVVLLVVYGLFPYFKLDSVFSIFLGLRVFLF